MASLTRAEMEKVIHEGGSVFHRNAKGELRLITKAENLPSDAELAKQGGSTTDKAAAKKALLERAKLLQAEADAMDEPAPAKADAKADDAKAPHPAEPAKVEPPKGK